MALPFLFGASPWSEDPGGDPRPAFAGVVFALETAQLAIGRGRQ